MIGLTGRRDIWEGHQWLWAIASDGREGWIPDNLVVEDNGTTIANRDYSAIELSVGVGEFVNTGESTHGWVWCRNKSGAEGWVPLRCLKASNAKA